MTLAASVASATAVGCTTGVVSKNPSFWLVAVPIFVPVVVFRIMLVASAIVTPDNVLFVRVSVEEMVGTATELAV